MRDAPSIRRIQQDVHMYAYNSVLQCPARRTRAHEASGRRSGHMDANKEPRRANIEVDVGVVGYWPFVVLVSGEVGSGRWQADVAVAW